MTSRTQPTGVYNAKEPIYIRCHCGQSFILKRKGKIHCSPKCRLAFHMAKTNAELREAIIQRHISNMNAELQERGLELF